MLNKECYMKLETTWWNDDKVKRIDWDSRTRSNQPEVTLCIPLRNIQIIQDPNFTRIFLPRQLRLLCWGHKNWALKLSAHNLSPNTLTESSHVNKSLFLSFCFLSRVTGFTLPTIWTIKFQNSEILHQVLLTMLLLPELRFLGWLLWRLSLSLSLSAPVVTATGPRRWLRPVSARGARLAPTWLLPRPLIGRGWVTWPHNKGSDWSRFIIS